MVIDNLDIRRAGGALRPFKANPPLIVDADAVLALSISSQHFKTVARQHGKISERNGGFQTIQLHARSPFDTGERLDTFPGRKILRPLVPIADDHKLG
jgi:hypothetical protein